MPAEFATRKTRASRTEFPDDLVILGCMREPSEPIRNPRWATPPLVRSVWASKCCHTCSSLDFTPAKYWLIMEGETVDVLVEGVFTVMGESLKSLGLILILTGRGGGCLTVGLGMGRSCCFRN